MKLKKNTEHENPKEKYKHENAKHLPDNAKKLAAKHPKGTFYGNRWFPYNTNE